MSTGKISTTDISEEVQKKLALMRQVGEEIIGEEELVSLLAKGENLVAYDGFEPSGQMHIAQGILRAVNVNKMVQAGFKFKMLVADWFAFLNNKLGGDLKKIQTTGEYFIEIWRACGMNLDHIEFIWSSDLVKEDGYWELVMRIAKNSTLKRILRTSQIMGRKQSEVMEASQIFYPCMQTADIFTLGARVTQLGMDQRKVNMLAREIGEELGYWKPVVVSHHMLRGLSKPTTTIESDATERAIAAKMSKSDPESAIFMTDSPDEVASKINKAYCPEGEVRDNPILEYYKYIVFEKFPTVRIKREVRYGGDCEFNSYQDLEKAFMHRELHPQDLKSATASYINQLLLPVTNYFVQNQKARTLLEKVKSFEQTH